jgi:hypothetical protein
VYHLDILFVSRCCHQKSTKWSHLTEVRKFKKPVKIKQWEPPQDNFFIIFELKSDPERRLEDDFKICGDKTFCCVPSPSCPLKPLPQFHISVLQKWTKKRKSKSFVSKSEVFILWETERNLICQKKRKNENFISNFSDNFQFFLPFLHFQILSEIG